jgi:hypothetical protein
MRAFPPAGQSLGVPGGCLGGAPAWARNATVAEIGRLGERRTAAVLDAACDRPGGATVLHDLTIPGSSANIDHVVVSGRTVWIIDTKVWAPGFYWRLGGRAYRGLKRFEPAEKKTTTLAEDRLRGYLTGLSIPVTFARPTVAVWPSRTEKRTWTSLLRRVGDSPVVGSVAFTWAVRSMTATHGRFGRLRARTADPRLVGALSSLLAASNGRRVRRRGSRVRTGIRGARGV